MLRVVFSLIVGAWGLGALPAHAAIEPALAGQDLLSDRPVVMPLTDAKGATVVVFLSSRCPCSMSHEPALRDLHAQFASQGIRFVGVHSNVDETPAESARHFREARVPFPVLQDEAAQIANRFGALKTPHVFVWAGGKLVYQGGVDDSRVAASAKHHYLREALTAIVAGEPPPRGDSRTLGCVIRRP
ncbi:MAG: redoxin domain-containing protein [Bacteriovoracia bacterium]